jgi:hypothetical protein
MQPELPQIWVLESQQNEPQQVCEGGRRRRRRSLQPGPIAQSGAGRSLSYRPRRSQPSHWTNPTSNLHPNNLCRYFSKGPSSCQSAVFPHPAKGRPRKSERLALPRQDTERELIADVFYRHAQRTGTVLLRPARLWQGSAVRDAIRVVRGAGNTVGQIGLKPCGGRQCGLYGQLESESENGNLGQFRTIHGGP